MHVLQGQSIPSVLLGLGFWGNPHSSAWSDNLYIPLWDFALVNDQHVVYGWCPSRPAHETSCYKVVAMPTRRMQPKITLWWDAWLLCLQANQIVERLFVALGVAPSSPFEPQSSFPFLGLGLSFLFWIVLDLYWPFLKLYHFRRWKGFCINSYQLSFLANPNPI